MSNFKEKIKTLKQANRNLRADLKEAKHLINDMKMVISSFKLKS